MDTTQSNFHQKLREDYGFGILKDVRDYEKTVRKEARFRNHLHFSLHCKHHDVTPISLKLKSTARGKQADRILRRAEKNLLNVRISDIVHKLSLLEAEAVAARAPMRDELRADMFTEMGN